MGGGQWGRGRTRRGVDEGKGLGGSGAASVGLPVDRAALAPGRGGARQAPPLCVLWAGAVLAVVVGGGGGGGWGGSGGGGGGAGRRGRGPGLLLEVGDDHRQVAHRHLQVLSAAAVNVF